MHTGHRYSLAQTLSWSRRNIILPLLWALAVTAAVEVGGLHVLKLPWLPISAIAVAVAFYGVANVASSGHPRRW